MPALQTPPVEIVTGAPPVGSVIWLHGLGADGHDFAPIVPELALPPSLALRFIFPHAPAMPVTINAGYVMPAWYDIRHPNLGLGEDAGGIRASQQVVEDLIEREQERGIPDSRIVLAGFSQGGAIALHTALRHGHRLAGVLALSTYLPLKSALTAEASPANSTLPIFMAHGRHDTVVPLPLAAASRDVLLQAGYPLEWREYGMAHSVCADEIADIGAWLRDRFV